MLPDIDCQKWNKTLADVGGCILIWCLTVFKHAGASVVEQPSPARSLNCGALCVESLLELFDTSPLSFDHNTEVALCIGNRAATLFNWSKSFPKEFVVQVTATVELDCVGEFDVLFDISSCKSFGRLYV